MDFDEVAVKESPGLCRCCLSEGCYKDLSSEYSWMGETEIYADMLLECFDISVSQHVEGPNGPMRLICEVCITRLRDACNFKKQVQESEKKFVDMVGRGEFRHKASLVYESSASMKEEHSTLQVEYLDELDFGDDADDILKTDVETEQAEDITAIALPVKRGRGRPRKNPDVKSEKKKAKLEREEKPRTSKIRDKGLKLKKEYPQTYLEKLINIRRNIIYILYYGNVTPFHWNNSGLKCFYCNKAMPDGDTLVQHTIMKHSDLDLVEFIPTRILSKDVPIKIDVKNIACKICPEPLDNLDELISHIISVHEESYDYTPGACAFPFILTKDMWNCVQCGDPYDNFRCLMTHMYKSHTNHSFICQICGKSFLDHPRMKRHFSDSHIGFRCRFCGKMFDAVHKLGRHKQIAHGKVKNHSCNLCSSTFHNSYQVKVHMGKVHNVEKYIIKCELCPKVTSTKGAMVLHIQSMHSVPQYECDMCDYKCSIKWRVTLHKRKHLGERSYECSMCSRKFGRSSNLRVHMKVHTGNIGRVCRVCRKGFVDSSALSAHELEAHLKDI